MEAQAKEIVSRVETSQPFKKWKKEHTQGFLSHFFCPVNAQYQLQSPWEIGFFDPVKEKITVFVAGEKIEVKPEDEVFKEKSHQVEELNQEAVKVSFPEAVQTFAEQVEELFPKMQRGDGFVILQSMDEKALWNFTFITKALKFINIKINAETGVIESHMNMDLIDRGE